MQGLETIIRSERIPLAGSEFQELLKAVGGFHDAFIDTSRKLGDTWIIEIRHVYFLGVERYDAFGTHGCDLHLAGCNVPESWVGEAHDREIFEFGVARDQAHFVFTFDGMEMSGITFDPERSFAQWLFL